MKKFIKKLLLFILPVVAIAALAEILLREMPNDYKYKKHYLDSNPGSIQTLILGNSHTLYGLNPDFFKGEAFNAAHVSQSLDCDLALLKKYGSSLKNLKTVIIPISYFSFFESLEDSREAWRLKNYTLYYGLDNYHSITDFSEVLSNRPSYNFDRLYKYYAQEDSGITCSAKGWGTIYNSKNALNLYTTGPYTAAKHTLPIQSDKYRYVYKKLVGNARDIISWCEKNNVKLVLFTPPAFSSYRNKLNASQLNETIATANRLAAEFSNVRYLNLLADSRFTANDFYDADHLSEIGAKKLSVIMNDTLVFFR